MSKKLQVTELDFDNIKTNIKQYISSKPEFTDYDFEGSGLSVLIEIMAYNTYYNSVYTNAVYNESFLSTAVRYDNVLSIASELGYTARTITAPSADICITLEVDEDPENPEIVISKGTTFTTTLDGVAYNYVTVDDVVSFPPYDETLTVYEGKLHSQIINVTDDTISKYFIDNVNVDSAHITVAVNGVSYSYLDDILDGTPVSETYIINNVMNKVEIQFGNDVIGKGLRVGDLIEINYLTTNGSDSNGATSFSLGSINGNMPVTIDTKGGAILSSGGSDVENIDNIRYLAPLKYASQNRMVTKNDHIAILKQKYNIIKSLNVWGGEDHIPSQYGKVFISIKPTNSEVLTTEEKADIMETLNKYGMMATVYEIIDPEYIYLIPTIQLKYNSAETTKTKNDIITDVSNVVTAYTQNYLDRFSTYFKYSDFISKIDETNSAIQSNITSIQFEKRHTVETLNVPLVTSVYFGNAIIEGTISTQEYRDINYDLVTIFDKDGEIFENATNPIKIGTIDYTTGTIDFTNLHVRAFESGDTLNIKASPVEYDINPTLNNIVVLDTSLMEISIDNVI